MRANSIYFPFLFTVLITVNGFLYQANGQINGTWSGTMTESSVFTHRLTDVRDESGISINVTNNFGNGSFRKYGVGKTPDGIILMSQTCNGSGAAELTLASIDKAKSIYKIQAIAHTSTSCTSTGPGGTVTDIDSNDAVITVMDQPWDGDPKILKGSKTETTDTPDGGKLITTTTWNLVKQSEVELIVMPQKYDTWLPMPGRNEQTPGPEMMSVTLELKDRNGRPASEKAKSFEVRLTNTSKEKGITMNMPLVPAAQQLPDLRFQPQTGAIITEEGQVMIITCPAGCVTTSFRIACYDGGAWTTLTAVAVLETDSIKGALLEPGGEENIRIPKREDGAKIATVWLTQNGDPGETDDIEISAGSTNNGDGLSAYEEYRGVISEGRFKRLDPQKKEMGVLLKKTEVPLFSPGMSMFETATDIKVVRFIENEIGIDRRFNKNFNTANIYEQYVQKLEKGAVDSAVGENRPKTLLNKVPKLSDKVVIDVNQITRFYNNQVVRLPYTLEELIANTVAHELAHGVGVDHHGPPSDEPNKTIPPPSQTVDIYHIYGSDGIEIIRDRPFPIEGNIGVPGNDASGDLSCIMAYTSLYQWAYRVSMNGSINYYAVPLLPVGKKLCTTSTCDPPCINANNKYFGEARPGNCASLVKLKD